MKSADERRDALVRLAEQSGVLRRGDFVLKSGRRSSYFFNMGAISSGADLAELGRIYAGAITDNWPLRGEDAVQVLFGPAYKGIPLAVTAAVALTQQGLSFGVAYDRKEAKAGGEGGQLVGAQVADRRVLLLDDVLTAGTAVRMSLERVRRAGGQICGVLVAVDRCEPADEGDPDGPKVREVLEAELGVPVRAIASASDLGLQSTADSD